MTRERYESISLHNLREIAKNRGMRRISTLKKADLIDAMLKRDEEEAIILRNERIQRRQMQEAAQAAGNGKKPGRSENAEPGSSASDTGSELPDTGDGTGMDRSNDKKDTAAEIDNAGKAAGTNGPAETNADLQGNRNDISRQEGAAPEEEHFGADRKEKNTAGGSQARQRTQGTSRSRQGNGNYTSGNGAGRRQMNRQRREDLQNTQSGRQNRQGRQSGQTGYSSQTGRNRFADSSRDRTRLNEQYSDRNTAAEQTERARLPEQAAGDPAPAVSYSESSAEAAGAVVREQASVYQNMQSARQNDFSRQSAPGQGSVQAADDQGLSPDMQTETAGARLSRFYQPGRPDTPVFHKDELNAELDSGNMANGILEVMQDGFGFIRCANYMPGENDIYVAPSQIRRFGLKTGDIIVGNIRVRTQGEKFSALLYVKSVNGFSPEEATRRYNFEDMTPVFPDERIRLERNGSSVSMRIMDLISPVGKGQRGMIVSPPKAGKTTLIKEVARSVKYNNPEIHLIVLLIDERPEEVTDIREAIEGPDAEVIYSTFDELPEHHKRVSEMAIERARRLVEHKKDVMILLDSITRLTRAYNITEPSSGRTLSGGLDPAALHMPKRFFGAARNMREGGSLTILATALIETGSKMDDIVFEEFKGTGNMELVLDRRLSERRIFPAIDIVRSGTRRDDLLLTPDEQSAMSIVRRALNGLSAEQAVTQALDLFAKTRSNGEFVNMVRKIQWGSAAERQQ